MVTRTFTVDEAGAILKMTIVTTGGGSTADDGTYLVSWNGHGDALALSEIDASTGALTSANRYTYSTWGSPTVTTVNGYGDLGFRYLYVGRFDVQWDDFGGAGIAYMHARHYSPEFGRFLQPDPARAEANVYGYVGNSPQSQIDPSGLQIGTAIGTCGRMRVSVNASGARGYATIWADADCSLGVLAFTTWTISWYNFNRHVGSTISGSGMTLSTHWFSAIHYRKTGSGRIGVTVSTWVSSLWPWGGFCVGKLVYAETWIF